MKPSLKDVDQERLNYRVMENYAPHCPVPEVPFESRIQPDDSVLLVRLSAIGDAVRLLPVVHYLRRQGFQGTLGWAVQPPMDDLLKQWPQLDRVHRIDRHEWLKRPGHVVNQLQGIRSRNYDWAFDFHGLLKSGVVTLYSGAKRRVGFHPSHSREGNVWFMSDTISPLPQNLPRILKYVQLIRSVLPTSSFRRTNLQIEAPSFGSLRDEVTAAAESKPILVHPRTSHDRYGEAKEWPASRFATLSDRLSSISERPVLVTWGPGEKNTARDIAEQSADDVSVAPETPDLPHLFHLVQNATLVISGDTAPCHIADILGTPLVAIFGSSDHRVSAPLLTDYRFLTTRGEEEGTKDIPLERVFQASRDLLKNQTLKGLKEKGSMGEET